MSFFVALFAVGIAWSLTAIVRDWRDRPKRWP